jgi:hypothetical protein
MPTMSMKTKKPPIPPDTIEVNQIAAAAVVDPRTVKKRLAGEAVRPRARARIDRELAARGYELPES